MLSLVYFSNDTHLLVVITLDEDSVWYLAGCGWQTFVREIVIKLRFVVPMINRTDSDTAQKNPHSNFIRAH